MHVSSSPLWRCWLSPSSRSSTSSVGPVPPVSNFRSVHTFVLGIGGVWALNYSLFDGFGIATRSHDLGIVVTGFVVAGMTVPWRAIFGWMTHDRAAADETLGRPPHAGRLATGT